MMTKLFQFAPAACWGMLILYFSLDPSPPTFDYRLVSWDKFQHGAAYALLTLLIGIPLSGVIFRPRTGWLTAFLFAVLFGGALELAQGGLTAVRMAEWSDLLADTVGAGVVAGTALLRLGRRNSIRG